MFVVHDNVISNVSPAFPPNLTSIQIKPMEANAFAVCLKSHSSDSYYLYSPLSFFSSSNLKHRTLLELSRRSNTGRLFAFDKLIDSLMIAWYSSFKLKLNLNFAWSSKLLTQTVDAGRANHDSNGIHLLLQLLLPLVSLWRMLTPLQLAFFAKPAEPFESNSFLAFRIRSLSICAQSAPQNFNFIPDAHLHLVCLSSPWKVCSCFHV